MTHIPPRSPRTAPDLRSLWFGLLAGPIVWSIYFLVGYGLAEVACRLGLLESQVIGIPILSIIILLLTLAAFLVTLYAGFLAYRNWRPWERQAVKPDGAASAPSPLALRLPVPDPASPTQVGDRGTGQTTGWRASPPPAEGLRRAGDNPPLALPRPRSRGARDGALGGTGDAPAAAESPRLDWDSGQFMAFAGLQLSALFSFLILVTGLPVLVLHPCG